MTTIERIALIAMAVMALIGLLSATATLIGNLLPIESRLGQALRRFGSDLKTQQPATKQLEAKPEETKKDTPK